MDTNPKNPPPLSTREAIATAVVSWLLMVIGLAVMAYAIATSLT